MTDAQESALPEPKEPRYDFQRLDAHDGYQIIDSDAGGSLTLDVGLKCQDEYINPLPADRPGDGTVEVARWEPITAVHQGAMVRLRNCLEAVARYLTMGGTWPELVKSLTKMRTLAEDGFEYQGWHYLEGETLYDRETKLIINQHIFAADEDDGTLAPAVIWIEGEFIDTTTLQQIKEDRQADEEKTPDEEADEAASGPRGSAGGDLLELPFSQDPEEP